MIRSLLLLTLAAAPSALAQEPPAPTWPTGSVFDEPAAVAPAAQTTQEAADHACRGELYRRPGETRAACVARLVDTDALSAPLPQGRPPAENQCRRENRRSDDGLSFSVSISCESRVVITPSPQ